MEFCGDSVGSCLQSGALGLHTHLLCFLREVGALCLTQEVLAFLVCTGHPPPPTARPGASLASLQGACSSRGLWGPVALVRSPPGGFLVGRVPGGLAPGVTWNDLGSVED